MSQGRGLQLKALADSVQGLLLLCICSREILILKQLSKLQGKRYNWNHEKAKCLEHLRLLLLFHLKNCIGPNEATNGKLILWILQKHKLTEQKKKKKKMKK